MFSAGTGPSGGTFQRQDGDARPSRSARRAVRGPAAGAGDVRRRRRSPVGFAEGPAGSDPRVRDHVPASTDAHLVLAGPAVSSVTDDPEGGLVFSETQAGDSSMRKHAAGFRTLAALPMEDPEENAIVVNALQRYAAVIAQKAWQKDFGLTVAEAMWKARPVVASRIGGIQSQIVDGESGVLLDNRMTSLHSARPSPGCCSTRRGPPGSASPHASAFATSSQPPQPSRLSRESSTPLSSDEAFVAAR